MCFCLYSRTFIVSPAMRPPQNSSHIYAYAPPLSKTVNDRVRYSVHISVWPSSVY